MALPKHLAIHLQHQGLFKALRDGRTEEISRLLAEGANVDVQYYDGSTPLMEAAYNGHCRVAR